MPSPRRTGHFRLQVYGRDARTPVAEFSVANPTPGAHPSWTPDPLPARKRHGDLEVILTALTTGLALEDLSRSQGAVPLDARFVPPDPAMQQQSWSRASFRICEAGAASYSYSYSYSGAKRLLPSDLRWTVSGVAVPRPWTARTAAGSAITSQGGAWKLQGVLGKGAFGPDPLLMKGANTRLIVTSTLGDGLTMALQATDDQGRKVVCSPGGSIHMGPNYKWWFDLKTPPGTKRLTLRFSGWKGRSVEFLVRPGAA